MAQRLTFRAFRVIQLQDVFEMIVASGPVISERALL
jgi:hypothetical protein